VIPERIIFVSRGITVLCRMTGAQSQCEALCVSTIPKMGSSKQQSQSCELPACWTGITDYLFLLGLN